MKDDKNVERDIFLAALPGRQIVFENSGSAPYKDTIHDTKSLLYANSVLIIINRTIFSNAK